MLIDFEVENFRSFQGTKRFSLVASKATEFSNNIINLHELNLRLIRTAALYGPNASGKSNLLAAMHLLSDLLESPMERGLTRRGVILPFALDEASSTKPSNFRVNFLVERVLFEYSIGVRVDSIITEEKLVAHPHGRPQVWFHRQGEAFDFNRTYLKGQKQPLQGLTSPQTPLLAVAAAFGHNQLSPPAVWLVSNLRNRFVATDRNFRLNCKGPSTTEETARRYRTDAAFQMWADDFLRHADLGIQAVEIEVREEKLRRPITTREKDGTVTTLVREFTEEHHMPYFVHTGRQGFTARFDLSYESVGTRKLFAMMTPLYDVLRDGELAIVDELSASLHPSLVRELIRVFHDPMLNPKGAQLVFATHDTSLLNGGFFRRDQVWFTEKDHAGATDLYSLNDIKGVRKDESFEEGYLRGRYGAIPFFGRFDFPPIPDEPSETTGQDTQ